MTATGFAGKKGLVWSLLASWLIPLMMTGAYIVLAVTSETDTAGKAWMSVGLAFVFILWWLFRLLTEHAALARAVAVGDTERILELADKQLSGSRSASARGKLQLARAQAYEARGDWESALRAVDQIELATLLPRDRDGLQLHAACIRIAAYVETNRISDARHLLDADVTPLAVKLDRRTTDYIAANLASGRVLATEASAEAIAQLERVIDDVRAGSTQRAIAHFYAARCETARGNTAAARAHRAKAAQLLPGSWIADQNEPAAAKPI